MIKVDENDPVGEVQLSFPYRDVQIKRNADPKDLYALEEEIGRGKFGTVYRCKEKTSGLNLAAKFISCPKKEDRRNVEREIDIMKTLQHPRLIQIYDAFDNVKVMTVILELIEGGELFERVIDDDFILTEKACTIFMRQICEGVNFIHKQRILHLDMKPENILCLTKTGNRIKIIDFGLARKYDPDKKLQVLFGTPEFVAPEVVNFDEIGYGTDMWSVGVICYVLLSGLSPFMGHTDVETMANVTVAKYDFDDEAFHDISDNAKDFIEKLLIKDMSKRLTAEQCLDHEWLKRKKSILNRSSSMDVTKDNLKQFVERWNEHPNSPYIFEITSQFFPDEIGNRQSLQQSSLSGSSQSLEGECHSPCASLNEEDLSDNDSDSAFGATRSRIKNNHNTSVNGDFLTPTTSLEHIRRASDSQCFVTKPDIEERINLAEEIRKLSDKLFQLSNNIDTSCLTQSIKEEPKRYDPVEINKLPKDHPQSAACGIPWRRSKMKINVKSSRDVPLLPCGASTAIYKKHSSNVINNNKHTKSSTSNGYLSCNSNKNTFAPGTSPTTNTKNLLLQLLEHWDVPQVPTRPNTRHGSVSSEWTEEDNLGQRTISSLNTFFQSRATNKKITQFHFNKS